MEVILLIAGGMNPFDSVCHTFGTISTGGFSTRNDSIAGYSVYIQYIIGLFMFLSGVSFVIYYYIAKLNFRKVKQNDELWFYLAATLFAGTIGTSILLIYTTKSPELAFREGFFQVISIITTTGFVNTDYILWPEAGLYLIFILLFAGASTGSTTGSIKMIRHLVVIKNIRAVFAKLVHPNMIPQIRVNNKLLPERTNTSILSFIILYLLIFLAGTIIVVSTGIDPVTGASAVATSLGNVGPGIGNIGPINNYSQFSDFNKMLLSLLMIVGRLEIYTIYIVFTKSFWKL
jgi:trk system potassium uptake protein TrkH